MLRIIDRIPHSGYCPELNQKYTITVRYEGKVKLLPECDYHKRYGCSQKHCPINAEMPDNR